MAKKKRTMHRKSSPLTKEKNDQYSPLKNDIGEKGGESSYNPYKPGETSGAEDLDNSESPDNFSQTSDKSI